MPKCYMNISNKLLTITLTGRVSDPSLGDAYVDIKANEFFVWNGNKWVFTDNYGNRVASKEAALHELHARFPQLKTLWEEYCILKKLLIGGNPGKGNGTGKT